LQLTNISIPETSKEKGHWNAKDTDGRALLNILPFATTQVSGRRRNVRFRKQSVTAGIGFKWLRMEVDGGILTIQ